MEKNYISGIFIKEIGQYKQLAVSIKVSDFIHQLQAIEDKNGWANIIIAENKNVTSRGYTHHCYENTWKPLAEETRKAAEEILTPEEQAGNKELPF